MDEKKYKNFLIKYIINGKRHKEIIIYAVDKKRAYLRARMRLQDYYKAHIQITDIDPLGVIN
ncbi:MAG: hypothetical protein ACOWWH_00895 [Eubacteriaceae bacterium]